MFHFRYRMLFRRCFPDPSNHRHPYSQQINFPDLWNHPRRVTTILWWPQTKIAYFVDSSRIGPKLSVTHKTTTILFASNNPLLPKTKQKVLHHHCMWICKSLFCCTMLMFVSSSDCFVFDCPFSFPYHIYLRSRPCTSLEFLRIIDLSISVIMMSLFFDYR